MGKWSMAERVVFEQTIYDKIRAVVNNLEETERKADSEKAFSYDYRNFSASKIRKLHLGGVAIHPPAPKMRFMTCGIHPAYDYDIPRFACLWSERQDVTRVTLDLHPVKDVILYPDYVEKYLKPLYPLVKEALKLPWVEKEMRIPPPRYYVLSAQLSLYAIHGQFPIDQTERIWKLVLQYLDVWLEDWRKGAPIIGLEEKKANQYRMEMMSETYRRLDPGARLWIRIKGETLAKEMQDFSW